MNLDNEFCSRFPYCHDHRLQPCRLSRRSECRGGKSYSPRTRFLFVLLVIALEAFIFYEVFRDLNDVRPAKPQTHTIRVIPLADGQAQKLTSSLTEAHSKTGK